MPVDCRELHVVIEPADGPAGPDAPAAYRLLVRAPAAEGAGEVRASATCAFSPAAEPAWDAWT
jgi:hypothetical protein